MKLSKKEIEVIQNLRKSKQYYINPIVLRSLWAKKILTWDKEKVTLTDLGKTVEL